MRVLAMVHGYPPHHNAGAELTLHSLLRGLARRGHHVCVLLSRPTEAYRDYTLDGVEVVVYRTVSDPMRYFDGPARVDVVIAHLENTLRAAALADIFRVPMAHLIHNDHAFTKGALRRGPSQLAVFNTEWMRADYERSLDQLPPHVVVHPPVFPEEYVTTPGPSRFTLINLNRDKGGELFWRLAAELPHRKFLGVLGAYGEQVLPDEKRLPLPNVLLQSNVEPRDMAAHVYAKTRVLLMPSDYESYGRTAIEAACSGIPTIATPTPGLVEALGDAATYVEPRDIAGWKAAITRLSTPRGWAKASRLAKAHAQGLDPDTDLDRFADAMEGVVRRGFATVAG